MDKRILEQFLRIICCVQVWISKLSELLICHSVHMTGLVCIAVDSANTISCLESVNMLKVKQTVGIFSALSEHIFGLNECAWVLLINWEMLLAFCLQVLLAFSVYLLTVDIT